MDVKSIVIGSLVVLPVLGILITSYLFGGWVVKYVSPRFTFDDIPDLTGKVAIVTGTNQGIGYVTARELARKGARVIATARSIARGEESINRMKQELGPDKAKNVTLMEVDLASIATIKEFVKKFLELGLEIDIIVLNAGIMMAPFSKTVDGFESQIGTNYIGHWVLVKLLTPFITKSKKAEPCRVVHLSSDAHLTVYISGMRFDNFDNDNGYRETLSYGQSKLANILFAKELSNRYSGKDASYTGRRIESNALHPGTINTALLRHVHTRADKLWWLKSIIPYIREFANHWIFMTVEDGALNSLFVATSPKLNGVSGKYFVPIGRRGAPSPLASNPTVQKTLWEVSEKMTAKFL